MRRSIAAVLPAAALLLLAQGAARAAGAPSPAPPAADVSATARQVFARHQDAVVWVLGTMKMRFSGPGGPGMTEEEPVETLATFLHAPGLAVASLSTLDPSDLAAKMFASEVPEGEPKPELKIELTDLRVRLASGKEVPARLVMKDPDLDLAILRVDAPSGGPALPDPIPASQDVPVAPLDEVIFLGRLTPAFDRQPEVAIGRVRAVIRKPRVLYMTLEIPEPGTPVFTSAGRLAGVAAVHAGAPSRGFLSMMRGGDDIASPVIVPIEDVLEVVRQALGEEDEGKGRAAPSPASE